MNDLSLCLFCWLHTKELCDLSDPKGLTGNPKVIQVENGARLLDSMRTMTQLDSLRCNLNPIVCYSVGNGEFLWEFFLFFFEIGHQCSDARPNLSRRRSASLCRHPQLVVATTARFPADSSRHGRQGGTLRF